MSETKTLEQICDELYKKHHQYALGYANEEENFKSGFDAAIKLCEQGERDLVEAITPLWAQMKRAGLDDNRIWGHHFKRLDDVIMKHRGENHE